MSEHGIFCQRRLRCFPCLRVKNKHFGSEHTTVFWLHFRTSRGGVFVRGVGWSSHVRLRSLSFPANGLEQEVIERPFYPAFRQGKKKVEIDNIIYSSFVIYHFCLLNFTDSDRYCTDRETCLIVHIIYFKLCIGWPFTDYTFMLVRRLLVTGFGMIKSAFPFYYVVVRFVSFLYFWFI